MESPRAQCGVEVRVPERQVFPERQWAEMGVPGAGGVADWPSVDSPAAYSWIHR